MAQTILLVDDDESFRYACAKLIAGAGYNVEAAQDHRRALEILESPAAVDLLITDLVMPQAVNGCALARMARIRRHDLKTLYITGHEVPSHEAIGKILRKPIDDQVLLSEIRAVLAGSG